MVTSNAFNLFLKVGERCLTRHIAKSRGGEGSAFPWNAVHVHILLRHNYLNIIYSTVIGIYYCRRVKSLIVQWHLGMTRLQLSHPESSLILLRECQSTRHLDMTRCRLEPRFWFSVVLFLGCTRTFVNDNSDYLPALPAWIDVVGFHVHLLKSIMKAHSRSL